VTFLFLDHPDSIKFWKDLSKLTNKSKLQGGKKFYDMISYSFFKLIDTNPV